MRNILLFIVMSVTITVGLEASDKTMQLEQIQTMVQRLDFRSARNLDEAQLTWKGLLKFAESNEVDKVRIWGMMREMLVKSGEGLKAISSDSKFNGVPVRNVSVEGVPVSGMNPSDVKDPVVRKKYEEAIDQNRKLVEANNYKIELSQFHKKITMQTEMFLKKNSTNLPDAERDFQKLIASPKN